MELWRLDATELVRLIRVGQASSREAVTSCLARLDAVNGKLNAQNRWHLVGYGRGWRERHRGSLAQRR